MEQRLTSYQGELQEHLTLFRTLTGLEPYLNELLLKTIHTLQSGGKILLFGNGGSAADAQHIAAELMVKLQRNRQPIPAIALTTDTSILTSHGNDFGFDSVFQRQVDALAMPGDTVIAFTTSGNSKNINLALEHANQLGTNTAVFSGKGGGLSSKIAKLTINVPSMNTARIQEAHIFMGHWLCLEIENAVSAQGKMHE